MKQYVYTYIKVSQDQSRCSTCAYMLCSKINARGGYCDVNCDITEITNENTARLQLDCYANERVNIKSDDRSLLLFPSFVCTICIVRHIVWYIIMIKILFLCHADFIRWLRHWYTFAAYTLPRKHKRKEDIMYIHTYILHSVYVHVYTHTHIHVHGINFIFKAGTVHASLHPRIQAFRRVRIYI